VIYGFQITQLMMHGYDPRADLVELLELVRTGALRVHVDTAVPLAGASDAHRHIEARAHLGQVMVCPHA